MRHSAAHIMASAVLEPVPGGQAGDRPGHSRRLLLRLRPAAALTPPADLEAIEERMRTQVAGNLPFERSELDRPPPSTASRTRDRTTRSRSCGSCRTATSSASTGTAPSTTCAAACTWRDRRPGTVQAAELGRRLLAGRRAPPDAAAHLRHGLGDAGGPGPLPVAAGRGQEARPPQARARPGPVHLPPRVAGRSVLACAAWPSGARWRTGPARCGAPAASTRSGRPAWCARRCGRPGHWELYQDNMFVWTTTGICRA